MVRAVFIHLPKTAGTSFREALSLGFGPEAVSPPFAASRLSVEDADKLRRYEIVSGHISITDIEQFFPEAQIFTILRNPIERCLSWYYFARELSGFDDHADVAAAKSSDIHTFFDAGAEILFRNIFNRQVRQLGDHVLNREVDMNAAYNRAVLTVSRCVWIGVQDTLADDMARFAAVFPEMAGIAIPSLNATPRPPTTGAIDFTLRSRIEHQNVHDLRLFRLLSAPPTIQTPQATIMTAPG